MNIMVAKFDRNKAYDDLPVLPPKKDISKDPDVLIKLVEASRVLATVNGSLNRLPNPYMLVNTLALQEAKASTEIENIFTTEDELYKAISNSQNETKVDPATKEVLKYREAMWAGFKTMKESGEIDAKLVKAIVGQVKGTPGKYRSPQSQVVIKRGDSEFKSGEIIYTPPRKEGLIDNLMENLLDFMRDDDKYKLDPLLKMCISHYQFEAIHPFQDGNGRTGRILNLLYLINKGLLSHPVVYMSKYIIQNKGEYYFNLSGVTQRNDWKSWVVFMLLATEKSARHTNSKIDEILSQMDATLEFAKSKIKWYNKEINEALFSQPYIKPPVVGEVTGKTSRTTLTKYMNELVEYNILTPRKDGVEVYYMNQDLIRILED